MKVEAKNLGPAFCCLFFALSTRPPIPYILAEQSDSEARWLLSDFIVDGPNEIVFISVINLFLSHYHWQISSCFISFDVS